MRLIGFQTVARTNGLKRLSALDREIDELVGKHLGEPVVIPVEKAVELLGLAYANLEFDDDGDDERKAHLAALEHLSLTSKRANFKGRVWLLAAKDRNVSRYREEGRFSNAPDTKQQMDALGAKVNDIPALMLFRQNGEESKGWKRFEAELLKEDWTRVRPEVEVKKVAIPQGEETYILCRTSGRKEKEKAESLLQQYGNRTEGSGESGRHGAAERP